MAGMMAMRGNVRTLDALVVLAALVLAYAPLPADAADVHRPGLGDWGWTIDKKTLARERACVPPFVSACCDGLPRARGTPTLPSLHASVCSPADKVEVVEDPPPAGAGATAPADDKRQFLLLHCNAEHTSGFGDRVQVGQRPRAQHPRTALASPVDLAACVSASAHVRTCVRRVAQGIYQGLALARALGRTLVLSPFAVKQANYEFLMKKVKSLSPEQQIERVSAPQPPAVY